MNGVDASMTEANEQHEPSYYEIALTNRQVVVAFVVVEEHGCVVGQQAEVRLEAVGAGAERLLE